EGRIVRAEADPYRRLEAGGDGGDKVDAARAVALGDGERRRHDLRRGVAKGGPVHVAHRDRGDEVAVQQRRPGERQRLTADYGCFRGISQCGSERANLLRLVALAAGDGAGEGVEEDVLDALADTLGQRFVFQASNEARELGGGGGGAHQSSFAPESLTAFA